MVSLGFKVVSGGKNGANLPFFAFCGAKNGAKRTIFVNSGGEIYIS